MNNKTALYLYSVSKATLPEPEEVLSADELEHFQKMSSDKRRHEFLHGRLLIKSILKNIYGVKKPKILKKKSGKPYVRGFKFNLSHSNDFLALAVSKDVEVGVDIEQSGPKKHFLKIAEQYFSATENEFIHKGSSIEKQEWRFKNLWCLKEAYIKAVGGVVNKKNLRISFDIAKKCIEHSPEKRSIEMHLNQDLHLTVCTVGKSKMQVHEVTFAANHKLCLAKSKLKFISLS